jgi:cell division ATPase FtsA
VLAVGGHHFTNDLAVGLHTSLSEAERIKQRHGCTHPSPKRKGSNNDMAAHLLT